MGRVVFLPYESYEITRRKSLAIELPYSLRNLLPADIRKFRSLDWAAIILEEIDEYNMSRKRAAHHLNPRTWRLPAAQEGACIAQQIYAIRSGLV